MKRASIIAVSVVAVMLPAFAEDTVPYAYRPPVIGESYVPGQASPSVSCRGPRAFAVSRDPCVEPLKGARFHKRSRV